MVLALAMPLAFFLQFGPSDGDPWFLPTIAGTALVALALMFGAAVGVPHAMAAWRRVRLARIGHGFDVTRYLDLLAQQRRLARLVVRLRFRHPPDPTRLETVLHAVRGWLPELDDARWEARNTTLVLIGLERRTTDTYGNYTSVSQFFTNGPTHSDLMEIASKVVPPLDRMAPIIGVDVDIEGMVCPFDEEA